MGGPKSEPLTGEDPGFCDNLLICNYPRIPKCSHHSSSDTYQANLLHIFLNEKALATAQGQFYRQNRTTQTIYKIKACQLHAVLSVYFIQSGFEALLLYTTIYFPMQFYIMYLFHYIHNLLQMAELHQKAYKG